MRIVKSIEATGSDKGTVDDKKYKPASITAAGQA
jgi:hypothetical protein